jgi:D-alanine-D-alanine ligase
LGRQSLRPFVRHVLEALHANVAGTSAGAAQAADDKIEAQRRLRAAGLYVPRSTAISEEGRHPDLRFPLVVKRPFHHGSRGLRVVRSPRQLREVLRRWLPEEGEVLAEELVEGRELAAAVLEARGQAIALPVIEVDLGRRITYGAAMKWGDEPLPIAPAILDALSRARIAAAALRAFRALALRDYARFDLRLTPAGDPVLLEVNVRPSVEDGTELRLAAAQAGLEGPELVAVILDSAARRSGAKGSLQVVRATASRAISKLRRGALAWEDAPEGRARQ